MEYLSIKQTLNGLYIEGFPEAVKVIKIKGHKAKRLSDLALHKSDLVFSKKCLEALNITGDFPDSAIMRESL